MPRKPWFPFYVDDFWQDEAVQAMSLEEVGLYIRLLSLQWREGSIPADAEKIARIVHVDGSAMGDLWPAVSSCFGELESDPSRLVNPRLAAIQEHQTDVHQKRVEQGKKDARKRWATHGSPTTDPPDRDGSPMLEVESEVE